MPSYTTYWPADWVKTILKNGDSGPLSVIYGGDHRSQPPLGKVSVGDIVYPVTLADGRLFVIGRLTIREIVTADEYTEQLNIHRDPFMWDSYTIKHRDSITHKIPRTCANDAATGMDGTALVMRPVPADNIALIKLGPKSGCEQPLKMRNGSISINNFSGYFRRMSEDTASMFHGIISRI